MMTIGYEQYILNYALNIYGGSYNIKNNILFILVEKDEFKICLNDRFNKIITLYHRNQQTNLDGNKYWHVQGKFHTLDYTIFYAFTHSIGKENGIKNSKEDWDRFRADALKYSKY